MPETLEPDKHALDGVVRGLSAASKALRLYPATSPIPRQAVEAVAAALDGYLVIESSLHLAVGREGLTHSGELVAANSPGASDLAEDLRTHGVAEIEFVPGCTPEDLLGLLTVVMRDPEETREQGGVSALLGAAGVHGVRTTDIHLTVMEEELPDGEVDDFFRELASDADKLSTWLEAMAKRDPSALEDGLAELVAAAGEDGLEALAANLARAFADQDIPGRDALLSAAMEAGAQRDIAGQAFGHVGADVLASALTGGAFGANMLSLSSAMTRLPFGDRLSQVLEEVRRALPESGHTDREADFLGHMMEIRARTEPEPALVDADQTYRTIAKLADVSEEETERARSETAGARAFASAVATMLALLDQEQDATLYRRSVESLSALVPRLAEDGDLALAAQVLRELHAREESAAKPWPDLDAMLRGAIAAATGRRTMAAVLAAIIEDPGIARAARELVRLAGDGSDVALAEEALALKEDGLRAAEELVGHRIVDLLAAAAAGAQWFQVGAIARRLGAESDQRSIDALRRLASRPDEQSRREVANGLAGVDAPEAVRVLAGLARDDSAEVAAAAIRALSKSGHVEATEALARRLSELDIDGRDFVLAREIIGALARVDDPSATHALEALSGRKALIKRGHFAEVQELARQALEYRAKRGGPR